MQGKREGRSRDNAAVSSPRGWEDEADEGMEKSGGEASIHICKIINSILDTEFGGVWRKSVVGNLTIAQSLRLEPNRNVGFNPRVQVMTGWNAQTYRRKWRMRVQFYGWKKKKPMRKRTSTREWIKSGRCYWDGTMRTEEKQRWIWLIRARGTLSEWWEKPYSKGLSREWW